MLPSVPAAAGGTQRTTQPIVTGTTVLAIKYADGVMMSADTLGSYGNLSRFTDMRRMRVFGDNTIVGASGEYSDFQHIAEMLEEKIKDDKCWEDGCSMGPSEIHSYMTRVLYARRNKFNPLWNTLVIAGKKKGKTFLGTVDLIGTAYTDDFIATGFGAHFALPLLRKSWRADMTEAEARTLLQDCMRVCYYRDCRTINRIQLAKSDDDGSIVSEPFKLDTKWDFDSFVKPKAGSDTGGSW